MTLARKTATEERAHASEKTRSRTTEDTAQKDQETGETGIQGPESPEGPREANRPEFAERPVSRFPG